MSASETEKRDISIYIKYIGAAFLIISIAVGIQFKYTIAVDSFSPYALFVPVLVALIFGTIIAKVKILQSSLQESVDSLQHEIEKNEQKDQIIYKQAKFVAKAEVLQAISHHWKQPLSALSLLIQDIDDAKEFNELDETYIKTFTEKSLKIIQDMDSTIDAFKNIFSADDQYTREFFIKDAVQKALYITKQRIDTHNIDLVFNIKDQDITLNTFEKEYIQTLINIVSNAIEALDAKSDNKKIVLTLYREENGKSVLEIYDNGDRIPPEDIDKIFDPYFSTKFDKNGTGLGLFTSRSFVENRLNGNLYVQNKDSGVSFKIVV